MVLDTTHGCWVTPVGNAASGEDFTRRCRHAVASVGPFVFIYGGLKVRSSLGLDKRDRREGDSEASRANSMTHLPTGGGETGEGRCAGLI